jgi:Uma2 family endonuclease
VDLHWKGRAVTATIPIAERNLGSLTVGELYEKFGPIPLSRLRLDRYPGTEEDVIEIHAKEKKLCELFDDLLVEKPMGAAESQIAMILGSLILNFLRDHELGTVYGEGGMMRLTPTLVLIPDVAFVSWDQFPGGKSTLEPIPSIHPDIAVEVLSRSNTPKEMKKKRREYFDNGTRLVWIVDPVSRTVNVYTSEKPDVPTVLTETDVVSGDPVLQGFSFPVAKLFEKLARG